METKPRVPSAKSSICEVATLTGFEPVLLP